MQFVESFWWKSVDPREMHFPNFFTKGTFSLKYLIMPWEPLLIRGPAIESSKPRPILIDVVEKKNVPEEWGRQRGNYHEDYLWRHQHHLHPCLTMLPSCRHHLTWSQILVRLNHCSWYYNSMGGRGCILGLGSIGYSLSSCGLKQKPKPVRMMPPSIPRLI